MTTPKRVVNLHLSPSPRHEGMTGFHRALFRRTAQISCFLSQGQRNKTLRMFEQKATKQTKNEAAKMKESCSISLSFSYLKLPFFEPCRFSLYKTLFRARVKPCKKQ